MKAKKLCTATTQQLRGLLGSSLTTSGRAPNEMTDGALGDVLLDLNLGVTDLLCNLRCVGWKHNLTEVFYGI